MNRINKKNKTGVSLILTDEQVAERLAKKQELRQ